MPRRWVWLQLAMGWLPVWALYTALIVFEHGPTSTAHAALIALQAVLPAALLGLVVFRFTRRLPWPRPFRPGFLALHVAAALTYAITWIVALSLVESAVRCSSCSPRTRRWPRTSVAPNSSACSIRATTSAAPARWWTAPSAKR